MKQTMAWVGVNSALMLVLVGSTTTAEAKDPPLFKAKLTCTITKITGTMGSFAPPGVGDKLVVDATGPEIKRINTARGYVPTRGALKRQPTSQWSGHLATYRHATDTKDGSFTHLQLMVGKFTNGYGGRIQKLSRQHHDGLYYFAEIVLTCVPYKAR